MSIGVHVAADRHKLNSGRRTLCLAQASEPT
jgi:hypothetical protein